MNHNYEIVFFWCETDDDIIADVPELEFCSAFGDTYEDALREIQVAMGLWIEVVTDNGYSMREPKGRLVFALSTEESAQTLLSTGNGTPETAYRYEIIIYWSYAEDAFMAEVPELPIRAAKGHSYEDALKAVQEVASDWIEAQKKLGNPIPKPRAQPFLLTERDLVYGSLEKSGVVDD